MISIRRSNKDDIRAVMQFIATHWSSHHILSKNRSLMDWQHGTKDGYNYILAWDENILVGVLGYIPTRRYDDELSTNNILWLALWKVHDDYQSSMLGLRLLKTLASIEHNVVVGVNGINLTHPPMYKALGYQVYDLCQYYLINSDAQQNLLHNPENLPLATAVYGRAVLKRMYSSDLEDLRLPLDSTSPLKTPKYFKKRFTQHPFYNYEVFGIFLDGTLRAVIATRVAEQNGSSALRIVDFIGDANVIGDCGTAFQNLMSEHCAEYMDFWQYGVPLKTLARAGFKAVDPAGEFICPNFFEPFIAENARIICCFKGSLDGSFIVCRADGDQDRPNVLGNS